MITLFGDKGSPGCTTAGLALAMVGDATFIEADPVGGDIAYRLRSGHHPLPEAPTVLTAAALARTMEPSEVLREASHAVGDRLRVIPGYTAAELAGSVDWTRLAHTLRDADRPVVIDAGRASSTSPALPVLAEADLVVAVLRPSLESLLRMRDRLQRLLPVLADLRSAPPLVVPVVISRRRQGRSLTAEVDAFLAESTVAPVVRPAVLVAEDAAGTADLYRGRLRRGALAATAQSAWDVLSLTAAERASTAGVL